MRRIRSTLVAAFGLSLIGVSTCSAGPITPPPGPVSSTHKTLSEVEPRIALNSTNTPGDADSLFKITQPGSYYLTGNVTVGSGLSGIEIDASNVTIDLMGFRLLGQVGSASGILVQGTESNITIRNGSVRSFGGDGIAGLNGDAMRVSDFTALNCNGHGVAVGQGSVLVNVVADSNIGTGIRALTAATLVSCTAHENQGGGIHVDAYASVVGCTAAQNVGTGILVAAFCSVHACSSVNNESDGFASANTSTITASTATGNAGDGFQMTGGGSLIANCTGKLNQDNGIQCQSGDAVIGCAVSLSGNEGILAASNSLVEQCVVTTSGSHGISATNDCTIRGNICDGNGVDGLSAGIRVTSTDNVIDGNQCTDNDYGVQVISSGNMIIRNFCSGNTTLNWDIVANNKCLVVLGANAGAISGDSGGASPGSANPWANFTY